MKVILNNLFPGTWIGMIVVINAIIRCFYTPPVRPYLLILMVVCFIGSYLLVKNILKKEEK